MQGTSSRERWTQSPTHASRCTPAVRSAVAICEMCAVIDDCLSHALEARERFGIWGGTNEKQRKQILRGLE